MTEATIHRCETTNLKCPGCNYSVTNAFRLSEDETVTEQDGYHNGNCADCLFDILESRGATVTFGESAKDADSKTATNKP